MKNFIFFHMEIVTDNIILWKFQQIFRVFFVKVSNLFLSLKFYWLFLVPSFAYFWSNYQEIQLLVLGPFVHFGAYIESKLCLKYGFKSLNFDIRIWRSKTSIRNIIIYNFIIVYIIILSHVKLYVEHWLFTSD